MNLATGALGTPSTWGTGGQCDEPFAARVTGRNEILTLRHDTVDNDVNHAVAMVNGQCEGCRVQLTANELQVLRRGERFTCQNCNRILVLN